MMMSARMDENTPMHMNSVKKAVHTPVKNDPLCTGLMVLMRQGDSDMFSSRNTQ
jgi:hypothetical protein